MIKDVVAASTFPPYNFPGRLNGEATCHLFTHFLCLPAPLWAATEYGVIRKRWKEGGREGRTRRRRKRRRRRPATIAFVELEEEEEESKSELAAGRLAGLRSSKWGDCV